MLFYRTHFRYNRFSSAHCRVERALKGTRPYCPCWITRISVTLEFDFKVSLFEQQTNDKNKVSYNHV